MKRSIIHEPRELRPPAAASRPCRGVAPATSRDAPRRGGEITFGLLLNRPGSWPEPKVKLGQQRRAYRPDPRIQRVIAVRSRRSCCPLWQTHCQMPQLMPPPPPPPAAPPPAALPPAAPPPAAANGRNRLRCRRALRAGAIRIARSLWNPRASAVPRGSAPFGAQDSHNLKHHARCCRHAASRTRVSCASL